MATKKKDNKKLLKIIIVAAVVVIIGVALVVVLNLPGSEDNKDTQEVTKEAKISDTVDKNKMHQAELLKQLRSLRNRYSCASSDQPDHMSGLHLFPDHLKQKLSGLRKASCHQLF